MTITATSPAHAAGVFDVTVTTPAGTSAVVAADQFTFGNATPASIPTMTPMGLAVMVMLLMGFGAMLLRQRRNA